MKKSVVIASVCILLTACSLTKNNSLEIISQTGKTTLAIEVVKTEAERERGLMYRTELDENSGMLFIFQQTGIKTFWMKNTLIPLDMLFIDTDKKIIHIEKNVPPCKSDPCPVYSSGKPVFYVLEVNGGFADRHKITEGNNIVLPSPL